MNLDYIRAELVNGAEISYKVGERLVTRITALDEDCVIEFEDDDVVVIKGNQVCRWQYRRPRGYDAGKAFA